MYNCHIIHDRRTQHGLHDKFDYTTSPTIQHATTRHGSPTIRHGSPTTRHGSPTTRHSDNTTGKSDNTTRQQHDTTSPTRRHGDNATRQQLDLSHRLCLNMNGILNILFPLPLGLGLDGPRNVASRNKSVACPRSKAEMRANDGG
jgi:hypothetical protein